MKSPGKILKRTATKNFEGSLWATNHLNNIHVVSTASEMIPCWNAIWSATWRIKKDSLKRQTPSPWLSGIVSEWEFPMDLHTSWTTWEPRLIWLKKSYKYELAWEVVQTQESPAQIIGSSYYYIKYDLCFVSLPGVVGMRLLPFCWKRLFLNISFFSLPLLRM